MNHNNAGLEAAQADTSDEGDTNQAPQLGPSTQAVHGARRVNPYHSVAEPIVQTATYTFEDTADLSNFMEARMWGREETGRSEYGRYGNPHRHSRRTAPGGAGRCWGCLAVFFWHGCYLDSAIGHAAHRRAHCHHR